MIDDVDDDARYRLTEKGKNQALVMGVAFMGGVDIDTLAFVFNMEIPQAKITLYMAGVYRESVQSS